MMDVKKAKIKPKTQDTSEQDPSALLLSLEVMNASVSHFIAAAIIFVITISRYVANSGYSQASPGAVWMIGSPFFVVPVILFGALLIGACKFIIKWGIKAQKRKLAYAITNASLLLIPLSALVTSHTITQNLTLLPNSEAERISCYTSPHQPDDDIRWVDNECRKYRTVYYLAEEISYSNREIKDGKFVYTFSTDGDWEGKHYKAGETMTRSTPVVSDPLGTFDTCDGDRDCREGKLSAQDTYTTYEKSIREENVPLAVGGGYIHANTPQEEVTIDGVKYGSSSQLAKTLPFQHVRDKRLYVKQ